MCVCVGAGSSSSSSGSTDTKLHRLTSVVSQASADCPGENGNDNRARFNGVTLTPATCAVGDRPLEIVVQVHPHV